MKRPKPLSYNETVRFHGHNGPYLALGYRLGRHIVSRLKPRGIMDLRITIRTRMEKPYTCLVDGLQCSTLATIGKGNLLLRKEKGSAIKVKVEMGKRIHRFKINKQVLDICKKAKDLDRTAARILKISPGKLWTD